MAWKATTAVDSTIVTQNEKQTKVHDMTQQRIELLRSELREALFLDLDEYALEGDGGELYSTFVGLQLHSTFQPIIAAHSQGHVGYEALLRPSLGNVEALTPQFAFDFADNQGKLVKFDRVCRALHTLNFLQLPQHDGLLFLNVHPKLLPSVNAHGKVFERILHAHSVPTHRVVIEIEESLVEFDKPLNEAIGNYRDRHYRIAIDRFGRKHSNLERLWRLAPDFVKLDSSLIQEAESNRRVRAILPKLVEIIQELDAEAVIVGIENQAQYGIALDSGATLLQGYHLGKPISALTWRYLAEA